MSKDSVVPGSKGDDPSKMGAAEPARTQGSQAPKNAVPLGSTTEMPAMGAVASTSSRATVTPGEQPAAQDNLVQGRQDPRQPQLARDDEIANLRHVVERQAARLDVLERQQARDQAAKEAVPELTKEEAQKRANETGRGVLSRDGYVMPTVKRVPAALMQIPQ